LGCLLFFAEHNGEHEKGNHKGEQEKGERKGEHEKGEHKDEHKKLSQLLIIRPQWLIDALACIIHDPNVHRDAVRSLPMALKPSYKSFEKQGVLPDSLARALLKNL